MNSTGKTPLVRKIRSYLEERSIKADSSILVAVSGGPDSTALLRGLHSLYSSRRMKLRCCCYNHRLRPGRDTAEEREFVRGLAESLEIPFFYGEAPEGAIEAYAEKHGTGIEAAARLFRYRFFEKTLAERGGGYLALGHSKDDQDETVIMRFFQGAGLSGLKGMPEYTGTVIRPIIGCTRGEILEYLDSLHQAYRIDLTNRQNRFLRNRIRNTLLPGLREVFPGLPAALGRFREKAGMADEFIADEAEKRILWTASPPEASGPRSWTTDLGLFLQSSGIIRLYALYGVCSRILGSNGQGTEESVPYRFLRPLVFFEQSLKNGTLPDPSSIIPPGSTEFMSGHGLLFAFTAPDAERHFLTVSGDVATAEKKGYCIILEDNFPFKSELIGFQIEKTLLSSYTGDWSHIDAEDIAYPLVVRSVRSGDIIELKEGKKKVRKIFQEWKIREPDLWRIPILEDRRGILAVCGAFFDHENRRAAPEPSGIKKQSKKILVFSKCGEGKL